MTGQLGNISGTAGDVLTMEIGIMRRRPTLVTQAAMLTLVVSFSNSAFSGVTIGPGIPQDTLHTGTIVQFSAEPGSVAVEGFGPSNSPYTEALLRYLEEPMDVGSMLRSVRDTVFLATVGRQKPTIVYSSIAGSRAYLTADTMKQPEGQVPSGANEPHATRVALTIGNDAYETCMRLAGSVSDAGAVANVLERLGFQVARLENVDRRELLEGLQEFAWKAWKAEIAVVYYSGHTGAADGYNYLVPVDADFDSLRVEEFADQTVLLSEVVHASERASKLRMIVVDGSFGGVVSRPRPQA